MSFLPNFFTILRIILIPFFIHYFLGEEYLLAGGVFAVSALTDFLDGYIARKYNLISRLGTLLDPLADKLTVISILVVLIISEVIPRYITIILLIREAFIFISGGITYFLGIDVINPSYLGKTSMFLLYLAITFQLLGIDGIGMALFYIVIPLNIISGGGYVYTAYQRLKRQS